LHDSEKIFPSAVLNYLFIFYIVIIIFVFSKCSCSTHTCHTICFNINITSVSYKNQEDSRRSRIDRICVAGVVVTLTSFQPQTLTFSAHNDPVSLDGRRLDLTGWIFTFVIHHFCQQKYKQIIRLYLSHAGRCSPRHMSVTSHHPQHRD